jgi:hypothetical protein
MQMNGATFTLWLLYPQCGPQFLSALNEEGKIPTASKSLISVNQSLPLPSLTVLAQLLSKNISRILPVNMQVAILQPDTTHVVIRYTPWQG